MASNKRVDVTLGFTADTNKVKKQLQDLQKQLNSLITSPTKNPIGISKEIEQASVAAATLKTQLENATNIDTGTLDLGKFTRSLKQSGYELKDYKAALSKLGYEGNKAFTSLAKSIMYAEAPLKKTNAMLDRFAKTFKSVISWQISSNVLNLFTGTLSDAYNYAKSLDASLNSIRIVTGKTTDQMARFAEEANKAARSLSTTTTAYTDASLIFFQQGLPEAEVKSRTDAVIKMSNVTGEAAADVSSYMTAIWNNFAKGNKDLESFADTITALGAATASSTKEIAGGLEKFSAVANQIGLSYEYATTALATVVARTRQSEDIVGTAFKTIFARLQSLSLGETLDDDTNLTKYSKALAGVGVSIKDTNGELKSMDDILDDLGGKWDNLSRAQQTALAQTVAGQRQYNQFIALMDSWNTDFQKNLAIANSSEGALQKQADIYAESWEAAHKRVTSAWQGLYDELIDEKFFISIENGIAGLIDVVNNFVKGLGGVQGVLVSLGSILTNIFAKQGASAINSFLENMYKLSSKGKDEMANLRKNAVDLLKETANSGFAYGNYQESVTEAYTKQSVAQNLLLNNADKMSQQQKLIAQQLLDQHEQLVKNVEEYARYNKEAELNANKTANEASKKFKNTDIKSNLKEITQVTATKETADNFLNNFGIPTDETLQKQIEGYKESFKLLEDAIKKSGKTQEELFGIKGIKIFSDFKKAIEEPTISVEKLEDATKEFWNSIEQLESETELNKIRIINPEEGQLETLENYFERLKKIYEDGYEDINSINQVEIDTNIGKELATIEEEAINQFGSLENAFGKQGIKMLNDIRQAMDSGELSADNYKETIEILNLYLEDYHKECNKSNKATKEQKKAFNEAEQEAKNLGEAAGNLLRVNAELNQGSNGIKTFFDNLKKQGIKAGEVVMTTVSSVTALMSAYKAFTSIAQVSQQIAEGQIDTFEGLSQIFSSLSFIIPNLISNGTKLFGMFRKVTKTVMGASIATAGFVAAAVAIGFAIKAIIGHIQKLKANSLEGRLKTAKEEAAKLATELENANAKAEEVKNTFNTYAEIKKNLDECTKGTKEWYEALEKTNGSVLDLIKQFPQLVTMVNEAGESAISFNAETGNTEIADWAIEKLISDSKKQAFVSQGTNILANKNIQTSENEINSDINKRLNDVTSRYNSLGRLEQSLFESTFYNQEKLKNTENSELKEEIKEFFKENKTFFKKAPTDEEIDSIILELRKGNIEYKNIQTTIDKSANAQYKALLSSFVRENESVKNSQYSSQILNAITQGYENVLKNIEEINISEESLQEYADYLNLGEVTNLKQDGNNVTYYLDGKKVTEDIQTTKTKLISAKASETVEVNTPEITELITKLFEGNAITKVLGGALGLEDLNSFSSSEISKSLGNLSRSGFEKVAKLYISEEQLEKLGYTFESFYKKVVKYIKDYTDAEIDIQEKIIGKVSNDIYESLSPQRKNLNIEEQEILVNTLNKINLRGGITATDKAGTFLKSLDSDELKVFIDNINTIDWNNLNLQTFKDTLKELNIEVETSDEYLNSLISSMRDNDTRTIKSIQVINAEREKAFKNLEQYGTISAEDFEKVGKGLEKLFIQLQDGSYALKVSSEELDKSVKKLQSKELKSFASDRIKTYSTIKNTNTEERATNEKDARGQIAAILQYNLDENTSKTIGELQAKATLDTKDYAEIFKILTELQNTQGAISDRLTVENEQLKTAIINYLLTQENIDAALLEFQNLGITITKEEIDSVRVYNSLQEESSDRIQEIIKYSKELAKIVPEDNLKQGETYEILAKKILNSNDAITTIKDNFTSWETILRNSSSTAPEYISALNEMQKAVSTLFGIQEKAITADFFKQNKEALEQLSKGVTSVEVFDANGKGYTVTQEDYLNFVAYNKELEKYAEYLISIGVTTDRKEAFNIASQINESNEAIKTLTDNFDSWENTLKKGEEGTQEYQQALYSIRNIIKTLTGKELNDLAILDNLGTLKNLIGGDIPIAIDGAIVKWRIYLNEVKKAEELTPPILKVTQEYLAEADALNKLNKQYEELNRQKSNATEQDQIEILKQQNDLLDEQIKIYDDLNKKYSADLQSTRDSINASEFGKNITFNKDGSVDLASYSKYITDEQNRIDQITNKEDNEAAQKKLDNFKSIIQTYLDLWSTFTKNAEAKTEAEYDKLQNEIESRKIEIQIQINAENIKDKIQQVAEEVANKTKSEIDREISKKEKEYSDLKTTKDKIQNLENRKKLEKQNRGVYESSLVSTKVARNATLDNARNFKTVKGKQADTYYTGNKIADTSKLLRDKSAGLLTDEEYNLIESILNNLYETDDNINTLNNNIEDTNTNIKDLSDQQKDVIEQDKREKNQKQIDNIKNAGEYINSFDFNQFRAEGSKNYKLEQAQIITGGALNTVGNVFDKMNSEEFKGLKFGEKLSAVSDIIADGVKNMMDNAQEKYMAKIDQVLENWDKLGEKFQTLLNSLDHYSNVAELLYGPNSDKTKELKKSANEAKINVSLSNMERQKTEKQKLTEQLSHMKEGDADYEKVKTQLDELNAEMEQSIESHLQLVKEQYALAVEEIMDNFEREMTGGDTLSKISERWQDSQELAKGYYDEVEKIYQLESLQNTLEKDIAGAGSAKEQQKITEFMNQQMKILKSKNKLSEQDMLIAQKKYDILKAEMDLEDARNNKNTMKLTRGSDGNWGYQYVANTDDILKKQQQVREANNGLYASMKSNFTSLTSDILNTAKTANQRITAIASEMDTADSERYAELEAEKQRLTELYYGNGGILSQKYSEYLQARDELTQVSGQSMLDFEDQTVTEMANKWKDDPDSLKNSALNAYTSMSQAQANVAKEIEKATAAIGKNFTNVENSILGTVEATKELSEQVSALGTDTEGIDNMRKAVEGLKVAYIAALAAQVALKFMTAQWVQGAAGAAALAAILAGDFLAGVSGFDTGGYTGNWGKDGKMAVLHEKELVLNKEDTANMLDAVSAVRDISSIGDSVASNVENGVSNMVANSLDLPATDLSGNVDNSETSTNNTFEITMNVDGGDVEEIKDAILSLPTLASQYLSKNQK